MSLYKRLHEVQQGPGAAAGQKRRDPVLDEEPVSGSTTI